MILKPGEEPKIHNVVTSFNESGYRKYGKEFIDTFLKFWPSNVRLTVYYEGDDFEFTSGLSWHPIEEVEHLSEFMSMLQFPIMHGIVGDHYDINFDARMGRKTMIENYAINRFGGKVFWIDADSVTHAPVPSTFLDEMLPDGKFCCYLGRDGWYYTESGFIGFNAAEEICSEFFLAYIQMFLTGVIFTQHGWHDCYAFDAVRKIAYTKGFQDKFVNLAEGLPHGTMHPLVNSRIGSVLDHRKGNRKDSRSSQSDLVVARDEPYWRGDVPTKSGA